MQRHARHGIQMLKTLKVQFLLSFFVGRAKYIAIRQNTKVTRLNCGLVTFRLTSIPTSLQKSMEINSFSAVCSNSNSLPVASSALLLLLLYYYYYRNNNLLLVSPSAFSTHLPTRVVSPSYPDSTSRHKQYPSLMRHFNAISVSPLRYAI